MLIATIFIIILTSTLYTIHAGLVVAANEDNTTAVKDDFLHFIKSVQHKLDTIDTSVQNLKEQAHTWAIFHHNINAWNDQMKSLEHKMDLIKRSQDEQQTFGMKLSSLEFVINHILSKLILLTNNHNKNCAVQPLQTSKANSINHNNLYTQNNECIELLRDIQHSLQRDKMYKNEISTRLSNIFRHIQNIENGKLSNNVTNSSHHDDDGIDEHRTNRIQQKQHASSNKISNFTLPPHCNQLNLNKILKSIEHKLQVMNPKDARHTHSLAKRNAKILENILNYVSNTNQQIVELQRSDLLSINNCRSISNELTTFTESSDLLLKRIELLVHNVNDRVNRLECHQSSGETTNEVTANESELENDNGNDCHDNDMSNERDISNESNETDNEEQEEQEEEEEEEVEEEESDVDVEEDERDDKETKEEEIEGGAAKIEDNEDQKEFNDNSNDNKSIDFIESNMKDCHELYRPRINGVYQFSKPNLNQAKRNFNERYCTFVKNDMGPAWTVIQNRGPYEKQENFNRSWSEYRNGFGNLNEEFWFGNEYTYHILDHNNYTLRVELEDFEGEHGWAEYTIFRLENESYNYKLLIHGYSGNIPDAMQYHNAIDFSTYDRRNDRIIDECCLHASGYASGWWFDSCSEVNLNGIYQDTALYHNYVGIIWQLWHGDYSLKRAKMMIRPTKFNKKVQLFEDF